MRLVFGAGMLIPLLLGSTLVFVLSFHELYVDEVVHYDQIGRFARGDISYNAALTTLPGYHVLLGFVGGITGVRSVSFMRLLSFLDRPCDDRDVLGH